MATINIPHDGLELSGSIFTDHTSSKSQPSTVQALHLSFPEQILADIVNSARKGTEKLVYSVSKPGKANVSHLFLIPSTDPTILTLFLDYYYRQRHISFRDPEEDVFRLSRVEAAGQA